MSSHTLVAASLLIPLVLARPLPTPSDFPSHSQPCLTRQCITLHAACSGSLFQRHPWSLQDPATAWHIRLVEVINLSSKARWSFPCNRWLAAQRSDGATQRELYPFGHASCLQPHMIDYQVHSRLASPPSKEQSPLCVNCVVAKLSIRMHTAAL